MDVVKLIDYCSVMGWLEWEDGCKYDMPIKARMKKKYVRNKTYALNKKVDQIVLD